MAFAGIFVLAGAGWALLAGAFLVFALWPQGAETALSQAWTRVLVLGRRAVAAPRRAVAAAGMGGGVALVPAGLIVAAGAGTGIVAFGALLIGVSLLAGWNA